MWGNHSHALCKNKRHRKAIMSAKCQSSRPSPPPFRAAYCHGQQVSYFSQHCKAPVFVYSTRCPSKTIGYGGRQKNYSLCAKMHYQQIKKSSSISQRQPAFDAVCTDSCSPAFVPADAQICSITSSRAELSRTMNR